MRLCTNALRVLLVTLLTLLLEGACFAAESPLQITLGAIESGTVLWELEAMRKLRLDAQNNVEVTVFPLADAKAGQIALQAGRVDVILSDFVYVSIQRNSGNMLSIVPHSLAVGGLIVNPASDIKTVDDLKGKTLAISGSPVDKSWVILQAYYAQRTGRKLDDDAVVRFGAPPLVNELVSSGRVDAALNLWNWNVQAVLAGKTELVSVPQMLSAIGISEVPPLLGWTFTEATAASKKPALDAFLDASFATKKVLLEDDAIWESLRPLMKAQDDATFTALRNEYRAGIVKSYGPNQVEAARQTFALLGQFGGADVVGDIPVLAEGTFWTGYGQ